MPTKAPSGLPSGGLDKTLEDARSGELQLLGRGPIPTEPLAAGSAFTLELWWSAEGPVAQDLSVRVTLDEPGRGALAADWSEPLGVPGFGSSSWPDDGIVIRQVVQVPVLADAAGGTYRVGVTPVEPDGTPHTSSKGSAEPPFDIGTVDVVARDLGSIVTEPPDVYWPMDASIGDVAELIGVNVLPGSLPGVASPGEALGIELVWRALNLSTTGYKVTVQLIDDEGRVVAQHDGEPGDWDRPTTGWIPGEIVVDPHVMSMPADVSAGRYQLVVGMYDPRTLRRLPVAGSDASGDVVFVTDVRVRDQSKR